jgi:hypothetical protein
MDSFHKTDTAIMPASTSAPASPSASASSRCGCVGGGTSHAYPRCGVELGQWYVGVRSAQYAPAPNSATATTVPIRSTHARKLSTG